MNVNTTWKFDKAPEPNADGDRPVRFTFQVETEGAHGTVMQFVLPSEAADKLAGDLLNVLSGGIEIARAMPEGGPR